MKIIYHYNDIHPLRNSTAATKCCRDAIDFLDEHFDVDSHPAVHWSKDTGSQLQFDHHTVIGAAVQYSPLSAYYHVHPEFELYYLVAMNYETYLLECFIVLDIKDEELSVLAKLIL